VTRRRRFPRGEPAGSISIVVRANGVRLLYWITGPNGERISVDEFVPFRHTPTRFGGHRQWLTCLRSGRRCRRIFGGRYFRCRQCHGLKYALWNESPAQRAMHRADKIANRLHDMWMGTTKGEWDYQRLLDQYDELQNRWDIGMMSMVIRLSSRLKPR